LSITHPNPIASRRVQCYPKVTFKNPEHYQKVNHLTYSRMRKTGESINFLNEFAI